MARAIVGIAFSVLFTVGFFPTTSVPGGKATDEEILKYYGNGQTTLPVVVGLYVLPIAGIAFLSVAVLTIVTLMFLTGIGAKLVGSGLDALLG